MFDHSFYVVRKKNVCSLFMLMTGENYFFSFVCLASFKMKNFSCRVAKTHAIVSGNKRLERALSTISEEKTTSESQKPCQPASPACPVSPASPAIAKKAAARQKSLKGIPLGVLEKVN